MPSPVSEQSIAQNLVLTIVLAVPPLFEQQVSEIFQCSQHSLIFICLVWPEAMKVKQRAAFRGFQAARQDA